MFNVGSSDFYLCELSKTGLYHIIILLSVTQNISEGTFGRKYSEGTPGRKQRI